MSLEVMIAAGINLIFLVFTILTFIVITNKDKKDFYEKYGRLENEVQTQKMLLLEARTDNKIITEVKISLDYTKIEMNKLHDKQGEIFTRIDGLSKELTTFSTSLLTALSEHEKREFIEINKKLETLNNNHSAGV